MKIHYSSQSIHDLARLRGFISVMNPVAAQRTAKELLDGINKLKVFPNMGLPVKRAQEPEVVRDFYIGQYTVRYLTTRKDIYILRIWHNRENEKDE